MELRHLRYFIAVAEELHFGRAAQRLMISQPPLSRQIHDLEREIKAPLLVRAHRQIQLTKAGELFLKRAREIVAQADAAVQAAHRAAAGNEGRIGIGYLGYAAIELMPAILAEYGRRFPQVQTVLERMSCVEQAAALREGRIDIGLLCSPVPDQGLRIEVLRREPLVVALPRAHRLAKLPKVPLPALADEAFIYSRLDSDMGFRGQVAAICQRGGFTLRIARQAYQEEAIFPLIASGLGVSLVPASVAKMHLPDIVLRELENGGDQIELAIAWRDRETSPFARNFLETARQINAKGAVHPLRLGASPFDPPAPPAPKRPPAA
jgi:DNA-binding transcriptional LysR family regulator